MTEVNIVKAPTMGNPIYQGPQGNLSLAEGYVDLASGTSSAKIELLELPIGIRIHAINYGYGSGVLGGKGMTIECGVQHPEDPAESTELMSCLSYSGSSKLTTLDKPYTTKKAGETLYVSIAPTEAIKSDGRLTITILYVVEGY